MEEQKKPPTKEKVVKMLEQLGAEIKTEVDKGEDPNVVSKVVGS